MKNFSCYQMALSLLRESRKLKLKNPYKDQFERAALSILLNLAEGSGKSSRKDRLRFFEISLGSLREVQALVEILDLSSIQTLADQVGAAIFCLCRSLRQ